MRRYLVIGLVTLLSAIFVSIAAAQNQDSTLALDNPTTPRITNIETTSTWMGVEWIPIPTPEDIPGFPYTLSLSFDETDDTGTTRTEWRYHIQIDKTGIPVSLSGLQANKQYKVRMGVVFGESGIHWSPATDAKTKPPTIPGPPINLKVRPGWTVNNTPVVKLDWEHGQNYGGAQITSYRIESSQSGDGLWSLVAQIPPGDYPWVGYSDIGTDDEGRPFTSHPNQFYRVAAVNEVGTGHFTQPVHSPDPLIAAYDTNMNGIIEKEEVIRAINDYLFGHGFPSKQEVIRLINLYLYG